MKCKMVKNTGEIAPVKYIDGWMIGDFMSFSTVFHSYQGDNGGLCAMKPRLRLRRFRLKQGSNLGLLDQ